jgi:hypothetical protein
MECTGKLIYMRDMNVHVSIGCQRSDSERHRRYWKVQCSGIGPITRVTDVPGGSRGARLTAEIKELNGSNALLKKTFRERCVKRESVKCEKGEREGEGKCQPGTS